MKDAKLLQDAIGKIDLSFVAEAERVVTTARKRPSVRTMIGLAATFLILLAIPLAVLLTRVPYYDEAHYTADEIAAIFDESYKGALGTATNQYQKVYAPSIEELYLSPLPSVEYLPVYETKHKSTALDEREFTDYISNIRGGFSRIVGHDFSGTLEIKRDSFSDFDALDSNRFEYGGQSLHFYQTSASHSFYFYSGIGWSSPSEPIEFFEFNGEAIKIGRADSNEEILAALEPLKQALCALFGESLNDVSIKRTVPTNGDPRATWITVTYYNVDEKLAGITNLSAAAPCTLEIELARPKNVDPAEHLYVYKISCHQDRKEKSQTLKVRSYVKMLPLSEAEQLLYKGYVFGFTACSICAKEQTPVDFEGYDAVELEYKSGFPFYAFYKKIGETENGNATFAKTYVPAFAVKGLDEYFASHHH